MKRNQNYEVACCECNTIVPKDEAHQSNANGVWIDEWTCNECMREQSKVAAHPEPKKGW